MGTYAADTDVSSEKSRGDIERTLSRYGAKSFMYGFDDTHAMVQFATHDRQVRFVLPMPDRHSREFTHTPSRNLPRSATQAAEAYEKAVRQRWRALNLVIKAKLEAIESGISSFDVEFLGQLVLPDGRTVADDVVPKIVDAYETHQLPALLPDFGPKAIGGGQS
ncbi:hypothetical protein [Mycolicibacterium sp. A43C]